MQNGGRCKLCLNDIWITVSQRLKFKTRSVYNVLPTLCNVQTWSSKDESNCKLCGSSANLKHILSSCSVALTDGRYIWRHILRFYPFMWSAEKKNTQRRTYKEQKKPEICQFCKDSGKQTHFKRVEGGGLLGITCTGER